MPQTESAKKALRQSARRRARNLMQRRVAERVIRECRKLLTAGKREEAGAALPAAYQALDKLAKTHVITRGKAARLKSRMARKLRGK